MFEFIKSLTLSEADSFGSNLPTYDGTNKTQPSANMDSKVSSETDVEFNNQRASLDSKNVDASAVTNYLDQAQEINDGVECVGFAVELDDGKLVKMYVNKADAEKFEDDLATALGGNEEFEDVILRFADQYDIVDVIWPDDTYPSETVSTDIQQPTDGEPQSTVDVPAETTDTKDGSELKSEISQDADKTDTAASDSTEKTTDAEAASDSAETSSTDDAEKSAEDGGDVSDDSSDLDSAQKEFDDLFGSDDSGDDTSKSDGENNGGDAETDTDEDKTDAETDTETDSADGDVKSETTDGTTDADQDESKSSDDTDDDVSVVIHPKKKKISESVEEVAAEKSKSNDLFHVMGLDSAFSTHGSKIDTLIGKRILAILGFIGIPGSMLNKFENLEDSINTAADAIAGKASSRSSFNKIYHQIITAEQHEKITDVEYREQFEKFLSVLGIDISKIQTTHQGVSAIIFGAYCISSNPETRVAFNTFMDTMSDGNHEETNDTPESPEVEKITESLQAKVSRDHDTMDKILKKYHSSYRQWMTRQQQVELSKWYLSGSDIVVFHFNADEIDDIPKNYHIFASSPEDQHGVIEVVCLKKPTAIISH